jgi:MoxR-like ATPase
MRARELADKIYLDSKIIEYILDIVIATRPGETHGLSERQQDADLSSLGSLIEFGASPRASIALATGAKALALLRERAYVLPQDVKDIAPDVLRHRLVLSYEAEAENIDADALIARILETLRTP